MATSDPPPAHSLDRRDFLARSVRGTAGLLAASALPTPLRGALLAREGDPVAEPSGRDGNPMHLASQVIPRDLRLVAGPGEADMGGGIKAPAWLINDLLPSPLLRITRGEEFSVRLENRLPEPFILHWHGLAPPEAMDGHPRLAVPTGGVYDYRFTVEDRGGTYWYHSHAHHRSGFHTYRGIAGLLIVDDPREEGLELPSGEFELPIILQDRRVDGAGRPIYEATGPAMMTGVMGDEPFGNGVHRPYREVDCAVYRLRLLNGSNARIFRLARSDGRPLLLVGNDGGLLSHPVELPWVEMGVGERVELLLDLRDREVGDRVTLTSLPFTIPGAMGGGGMGMGGMMARANRQGAAMDLLEFRVTRRTGDGGPVPGRLLPLPPLPDPAHAVRERHFRFDSRMMAHSINGRGFELDRVDERVPFGDTEIWTFENVSGFPHPVHLHATHFRVLSRSGGRGRVFPWEEGRKDTVLLHPLETVRVAVRFTAHRGLYLLHCHNLEHEDHGMMLNVLVE